MDSLKCPYCNSNRLKRNGIKKNGKQKYRCKDCGRRTVAPIGLQRTDEETTKFIFQEFKNTASAIISTASPLPVEDVLKSFGVDQNIWNVDRFSIQKRNDFLFEVKVNLIKKIPDIKKYPTISPIIINSSSFSIGSKSKTSKPGKFKKALILPDSQIGFLKNNNTGKLTSFHDRRCLDIALKVANIIKPDMVVFLGDMIDFPEQTNKFLKSPDFYFTTQPSIVELGWWVSQFRNILPNSKMVYVEGNHEFRLKRSVIENLIHSYDLKPFDDLSAPPALSVRNLLSLDKTGVEYIEDYPKGEFWINDNLRVIHGNIAKSGSGETVREILKQSRTSIIQGHIHRIETASKTVHIRNKIVSYVASSFGCLCKIDGTVPSFGGDENWQQGLGVVHYEEGNGRFQIQSYFINEGEMIFGENIICSEEKEYINALRKDTGWNF